jgi:hypothetical protein
MNLINSIITIISLLSTAALALPEYNPLSTVRVGFCNEKKEEIRCTKPAFVFEKKSYQIATQAAEMGGKPEDFEGLKIMSADEDIVW